MAVWETEGRRYLTFGNDVEQGCMDLQRPYCPPHLYSRMMLLGCLLQPQADAVAVLGLGAGTLLHALLRCLPGCRMDAVELRPLVVDVARQWFSLPDTRRLKVVQRSAAEYLHSAPQTADILFLDLYLADGMDAGQVSRPFLTSCRRALTPGGLLVANYWSGDKLTAYALNQTLVEVFAGAFVTLEIPDGNCILFAFDQRVPRLDRRDFYAAAAVLGEVLEVPMQQYARMLWRHSGGAFRMGTS